MKPLDGKLRRDQAIPFTLGHAGDGGIQLRCCGRCLHLLHACTQPAVGNVVEDGVVEQHSVLQTSVLAPVRQKFTSKDPATYQSDCGCLLITAFCMVI